MRTCRGSPRGRLSTALFLVVAWAGSVNADAATTGCGNESTTAPALQLLSPTPLLRPNASAAEVLQRRADELSNAVSNTSFAESRNNVTVYEIRHRKKQQQLMLIRAQILHRLGIRNPPANGSLSAPLNNSTLRLVEEIVRSPPPSVQDITTARTIYSERIQSFYPSCLTPNQTDPSAWNRPDHFRLHYDVSFPRSSPGTEVSLVSAKLRLYRTGAAITGGPSGTAAAHNLLDAPAAPVTVSVFQFLRPLKTGRLEKKELIVSRTLSSGRRGWEEFNVESAVSRWHRLRNKNYGLDIEVVDARGKKLLPGRYFRNMSCAQTEAGQQESPFPNIMRLHPGLRDNESSLLDNETYPTLDLQVVEVLRHDSGAVGPGSDSPQFVGADHAARPHRRRRRKVQDAAMVDGDHRTHSACAPRQIDVTFADLGLDNVLYPEGFTYSYCHGTCHCHGGRKRRGKGSRRPCVRAVSSCNWAKYVPLNLTYLDEDSVMTTTIENLVASDCRCSMRR
ncbi:bone morphogenetic protein 4 isoform X2 [Rhipicephalus sanguineus]|uniref:bone morphogenetic protein 4 isoform X2 n=1 Tax=Rhipicephalus sanguineus TaxID=34632 RepID=UPI0018936E26|nr:bone morphogenetic protein 4 isoform X2 [Rhipicephalus sanguineus]